MSKIHLVFDLSAKVLENLPIRKSYRTKLMESIYQLTIGCGNYTEKTYQNQ